MIESKRQRKLAILGVLKGAGQPVKSAQIAGALVEQGHESSERTVRLYLQELDEAGLTQSMGRRGRVITEEGLTELSASQTLARVGFLSAKIDQMTYRMDFDLALRTGTVVVNTTLVKRDQLARCVDRVCKVFADGYAMGNLLALLEPGEQIGDISIPDDMLGFCSVCSITLNGVLLKHGVPTHSRFGGLLELQDGRATRFVEMITYDGTSIDPLEVFIRSGMTDYVGAVTTGSGRIGASFREFPADSRDLVVDLAERLKTVGLGGFMRIGHPGRALLDIPVSEGLVGAIVIGGLNPMAILEEMGMRVYSRALSGLLGFNRLFPYQELKARV
jgi:HTH-type transcriptional regulator, global nitrogen regulator NrpRI